MLINISEFIYEGLIINEENNNFLFSDFIRYRQMSKLYQKFVLNFYSVHLDGRIYKVYTPKLKWNLEEEVNKEELSLLPEINVAFNICAKADYFIF